MKNIFCAFSDRIFARIGFELRSKSKGESFQNKKCILKEFLGRVQFHYLTMFFEGHTNAKIWNNQEEYYWGDDKLFQ